MRTKSIEIKDSFIDAAPAPVAPPPADTKPADDVAPDGKAFPHLAPDKKVEKLDLKSSFQPVTRHERPDPTPPPLTDEDFPLHPRSDYSPTKKL